MDTSRRLRRSTTNRIIAGVCGGIAEYLNVDATLVRLAFVLLVWFGMSPLVYLVLWAVLPTDRSMAQTFPQQVRENVSEIEHTARTAAQKVSDQVGRLSSKSQTSQSSQTGQSTVAQEQDNNQPTTGPTTRL